MARIDLDRIAFIGRTFHEYVHLFGLDDNTLAKGPILDCPAGASSFAAEGRKKGYDITACDLLYTLAPEELVRKARADTDYALTQAYKVRDIYDWGFYGGVEAHRAERLKALEKFSEDYREGAAKGRYVAAGLPRLPFKDNSFAMVLCSHFLFLYGDRLSFEFHARCIREFLRVGAEVRIYPVLGLDAAPYPELDELTALFRAGGITAGLEKVPFEFVKGGNTMLRITRPDLTKTWQAV